jgi:hypothetical protein
MTGGRGAEVIGDRGRPSDNGERLRKPTLNSSRTLAIARGAVALADTPV